MALVTHFTELRCSGNIAEAWRKRRYPKDFQSKLIDADGKEPKRRTG